MSSNEDWRKGEGGGDDVGHESGSQPEPWRRTSTPTVAHSAGRRSALRRGSAGASATKPSPLHSAKSAGYVAHKAPAILDHQHSINSDRGLGREQQQQQQLARGGDSAPTPATAQTPLLSSHLAKSMPPALASRHGEFRTESNDVVEWRMGASALETTKRQQTQLEGGGDLEEEEGSSTRFAIRITILSVLCVLFGISNNLTFFEMGQRMKDYPVFLLYFTTFAYTLLYFIWALGNAIFLPGREEPLHLYLLGRNYQRLFAWLGFWLTVNGLLSQFSDPHVDGNLQSVLYQLTLPATGLLAYFMLRERFSLLNLLGSALVLGGCLMVALPPLLKEEHDDAHNGTSTTVTPNMSLYSTSMPPTPPSDSGQPAYTSHASSSSSAEWLWIIVFALSVIPNGVCAVIQESLFRRHEHVDTVLLLFWSNFYTLFGYALALPLTMLPYLGHQSAKGVARNQRDAFRCLVGTDPLPRGCEDDAFVPVLAFVVSYMGFFYFLAQLVKEVGAVFESLVNGVVTPASAIAFGMRWLVKSDTEPLTAWVISASVIVPLGVLVYKADELKSFFGIGADGQELQAVTSKMYDPDECDGNGDHRANAHGRRHSSGITPASLVLDGGPMRTDDDERTPLLATASAPKSRRLSPATSPLLPLRFGHSTVATLEAARMLDSLSHAARRRSHSVER